MPDAEPTTYRTLPARIVGWVILLAVAAMAVVMGVVESRIGNNPLTPSAFLGMVAAIVWVVLLRPCARIGPDEVHLANLITDVTIPFARLSSVDHQWSLELVDNAGTKHSSWAIPVKRELRPRKRVDQYAEATARGKAHEGNNAEVVAGYVSTAWQRWKLAGGIEEPGKGVSRTLSWAAVGPLLVAVCYLVVMILVD